MFNIKAIVYEGIKDVKVKQVEDPKIIKDDDADEGEHAYTIFDAKQDNCIKVVLTP